jgi:hypothetical protein
MDLHKIFSKFFIIGLLVFLLINSSSLGFYQDKTSGSTLQRPVPSIFGKIGQNEWFITAVTIYFQYNPEEIKEIQYNLDNKWHVYTGYFNVTKDGMYSISWFWVDLKNKTFYELPIIFKIDQTPPTMKLTKKSGGQNKVIFTAVATDAVSQVERVEFYLDDVLTQTDSEVPYQYTWTGEDNHLVYAIGYNYAGLSEKSNNLSTPRLVFKYHYHYLIQRLFNFIQIILLKI